MRLFTLIFLMLSLTSCERALFPEEPEEDPVVVYDAMWKAIDQKYGLFDDKAVNWDSVNKIVRPQIQTIDNEVLLFDALSQVLSLLRDGHTNLVSPFDVFSYRNFYLQSADNFDFDLIERNYLKNNYRRTGPFWHTQINEVAYVYYGSFQGGFTNQNLSYLLAFHEDTKGMIIDVRENGGGSTTNADRLISLFTTETIEPLSIYYREGEDRNDLSEAYTITIDPHEDLNYDKPVIILTNRSSYSATNYFAGIMSTMPQVRLYGDTTGGGGGYPISQELPNGWRLRFSASRSVLAKKGISIEPGVPPDNYIPWDKQAEFNGVDVMIETALDSLQ